MFAGVATRREAGLRFGGRNRVAEVGGPPSLQVRRLRAVCAAVVVLVMNLTRSTVAVRGVRNSGRPTHDPIAMKVETA